MNKRLIKLKKNKADFFPDFIYTYIGPEGTPSSSELLEIKVCPRPGEHELHF